MSLMPDTDLVAAIRGRRTINRFQPRPVDPAIIHEALELARWAPNHYLSEPWHFYLIGEETRAQILDLNSTLVARSKGAEAAQAKRERWSAIPGWLVVTCERSEDPLRQQEDYAACCCLVQNLMLALWGQGIGSKWSTGPITREADFYDLIWVDPEAEQVVGLIWYGYPDEQPDSRRRPASASLVELP
ncbi:nitroreductase [Alkalilimnicola sp. S0819]|uniref:nitroreductase family protein n=1 Tax=Alkalilimnicola sp. S0819 TaxID=2613922 RepID=UPI0012629DFF|nr:nitroreductase [Alkalilimnicola sp. S0819]KAB7622793.1 nitroreductase [Alkalilimnicola sp. S0819]MPQ17289.1 nitroreductase [Alkalilimnicola sp. S0819]